MADRARQQAPSTVDPDSVNLFPTTFGMRYNKKMASKKNAKKLALVLSGGGARGAYEAGIIHYIRTMLPNPQRERAFDIHCGSSVGALNSCFLAATSDQLANQGRQIYKIWEQLREEHVYQKNLSSLFYFLTKIGFGMFFKLFKGAGRGSPHFPGVLDTTPFHPFLRRIIPWNKIHQNIERGLTQALSVVATNVFTGRMEIFLERHPSVRYSGDTLIHDIRIRAEHAAASAAIPIIFPSVLVGGIAYTDGGLRLNTPLSPAIHLGADSIFVVGLNHRAKSGEKVPFRGELGTPPALGQILGRVLNSLFLDHIQYDLEQLQRINYLLEAGEKIYGSAFIPDLNRSLKTESLPHDMAERGVKKLEVFRLRPSEDIGEIFTNCFRRGKKRHLGVLETLIIRALDIDPASGNDFLSYFLFMPEYLKTLLELGFEDARRHHTQIVEFFEA